MRIEEREAVVRWCFPSWLASLAVLLVGGAVVLVVFHSDPSWHQSVEGTAWILVAIGVIVSYYIGRGGQTTLLERVREWHRDEEEVRVELERSAADYLALYVFLPPDAQVTRANWHNAWEEQGLTFLAKQVQSAAERQKVVQQNLLATREEEDNAKQLYDVAANKFYATRDTLIVHGSEYAKGLHRWSYALQ